MNKILVSLLALGLLGSTANAASLINKTYKTAKAAAIGGGLYAFNKAAGGGRYRAPTLVKGLDTKGPSQSFRIESRDRAKIVKVIKVKGGFTAYIPNRTVYTPFSAYLKK